MEERKIRAGRLLSSALSYAEHGFHVFPLQPGRKEPLIRDWPSRATSDPITIREWWRRYPDANIGIATGPSGLVAIDVDVKDGALGMESWGDILQEHGHRLGETVTAETPTGGLHVIYRANGLAVRSSAGTLGPGLDVRACGGYIVAPPSVHPNGQRYEWALGCSPDDVDPIPLPTPLVQLLADVRRPASGAKPFEPIPEGRRNDALTSLAGSMRRIGMSGDAILAALRTTNQERCRPPLPTHEVAKIARSVARYPPPSASTLPLTIGGSMGSKVGRPPLRRVKASEVREKGLEGGDPLTYLPFLGLDGYVVRTWSHLLAGYPKSGKTELTTRLCHEWRDERILYFTEEPQSIWEARLAELPEGWDHVTLVFALGADRSAVLEMIKRRTATVVVIDTVRSLLGLRDETDNSEMARVLNPFIAACRQSDMTLLLLHHIRKGGGKHGEGITGGHAFLGVVDVALELLRADGGNQNQRKVRGWGRVIAIPELLYQRDDDGTFSVLGSPAQVELAKVQDRIMECLNGHWRIFR